jgi:hypothetical protein
MITALILRSLFERKTLLDALGSEDFPAEVRKGDWILYPNWPDPVKVVDWNWSIRAVALQLGPTGEIVVWPMRECCRRTTAPKALQEIGQ